MSFLREESAYRRGTVLGLTFAEIMLLLLFLLLISLSFFLQKKEKESQSIRDELTSVNHKLVNSKEENASLKEQLKAIGGNRNVAQKLDDAFKELRQAKEKIAQQQETISMLTEEVKSAENAIKHAKQTENKANAWDKLTSSFPQGAADPSVIIEQIETSAANKMVADAVQKASLPKDPEAFAKAIQDMREFEKLVIDAIGRKAEAEKIRDYWKRRAGLSNELPPCWVDSKTSAAEYIFDIELGSEGISVYAHPPEYRKAEMMALPLQNVVYGRSVDEKSFRSMLRPLYEWSEKKECKFYVRAFDETKAHEKKTFKSLLLTTEGYFYKYLVKDKGIKAGGN